MMACGVVSMPQVNGNFSSLTAKEAELQKLRQQVQEEWTQLRHAESELEDIKKVLLMEQQKSQSRLMEWESRLKQDDLSLQERQKMLEMKEAQLQRQQSPWLNPQSSESGLMSGEGAAVAAVASASGRKV